MSKQDWRNTMRSCMVGAVTEVLSIAMGALCRGLRDLTPAHLLSFEILVQQVQGFLVRTRTAGDRKHAFASFVVRCLGDRNACSRRFANFRDLAATSSDNAADHIRWYADVLGLDVFAFLDDWRRASI